jgi:hypothetical protein
MKKPIILCMICAMAYSCAQKADESADSLIAPKSENYAMSDSLSSPTFYEEQDEFSPEDSKRKTKSETVTEKTPQKSSFSLSQNLDNLSDTIYLQNVRLSKKFIKTANLRFKVKNVELATRHIEGMALRLHGYIHQSNIRSNYISGRTIELTPDSALSVFEYYISNDLTIRIPHIHFDSVMNELSRIYIYLDSRDIKTEDVSTIFLRNKLKAEKSTEYEKRIQKASDNYNRRLSDITDAERQAAELADRAIDKKIENYELQDRIDFSTISMTIYQANSVYEEKIKNTRLKQYQPNFWQRAWDGMRTGWNLILDVAIGLIYLWPLYLLVALVYFGIQYLRKWLKMRK